MLRSLGLVMACLGLLFSLGDALWVVDIVHLLLVCNPRLWEKVIAGFGERGVPDRVAPLVGGTIVGSKVASIGCVSGFEAVVAFETSWFGACSTRSLAGWSVRVAGSRLLRLPPAVGGVAAVAGAPFVADGAKGVNLFT